MTRDASTIKEPHRDLKVDDHGDYQNGADVLALQHAMNRRLRARGLDRFLVANDDGVYGPKVAFSASKTIWALGAMGSTVKDVRPNSHDEGDLTIGGQRMIRFPGRREDAQLQRASDRRKAIEEAAKVGVKIDGDKVTGGSARDRLKHAAEMACSLDAAGKRHSFYSQSGAWTTKYGITGEPRGDRSDCSQWITSIFWSCGLDDPNGTGYTGGYTGTLGNHGKAISRSQLRPGDLILYGPAPHHHVEMFIGPGSTTAGHGSRPVDHGWIDLAPDPHFRSYV